MSGVLFGVVTASDRPETGVLEGVEAAIEAVSAKACSSAGEPRAGPLKPSLDYAQHYCRTLVNTPCDTQNIPATEVKEGWKGASKALKLPRSSDFYQFIAMLLIGTRQAATAPKGPNYIVWPQLAPLPITGNRRPRVAVLCSFVSSENLVAPYSVPPPQVTCCFDFSFPPASRTQGPLHCNRTASPSGYEVQPPSEDGYGSTGPSRQNISERLTEMFRIPSHITPVVLQATASSPQRTEAHSSQSRAGLSRSFSLTSATPDDQFHKTRAIASSSTFSNRCLFLMGCVSTLPRASDATYQKPWTDGQIVGTASQLPISSLSHRAHQHGTTSSKYVDENNHSHIKNL
ncbi:hypothetical protein G7Y89_g13831 [Cudoniella acicularis]|uniref:Uncharacterized protein n=1 Tax=Cudoniella acicularis TaxID=354080 RepID=A0A8H4R8X4_9HELO|nr:hypothetical protein G7Y89_g13831 [Cudoniella acicularis]